jgi:hypothetical protein
MGLSIAARVSANDGTRGAAAGGAEGAGRPGPALAPVARVT